MMWVEGRMRAAAEQRREAAGAAMGRRVRQRERVQRVEIDVLDDG